MRKQKRTFLVYEVSSNIELWVTEPMILVETIYFVREKGSESRMKTGDYPRTAVNAILDIRHGGLPKYLKFLREDVETV